MFLPELSGLGIDSDTIGGILSTVEAYVYGFAQREAAEEEARRRAGMTEAEWHAAVATYFEQLLATGRYPTFARFAMASTASTVDTRFEFGRTVGFADGI